MKNINKRDVIRLFCEGHEKRFKKVSCRYYQHFQCILLEHNKDGRCNALPCHQLPCEHYDAADKRCALRSSLMEIFWKECRYDNIRYLYDTSNRHSESLKRTYKGYIDDREDVDFVRLAEELKKAELDKPLLSKWINYVSASIYRSIRNILDKRGLVYRKKECGTCRYLSASSKYCYQKHVARNKTDKPCEDYAQPYVVIGSTDADGHDDNPPEEMIHRDSENPEISETPETLLLKKEAAEQQPISVMKQLLSQRIDSQLPNSKRRQICQRQYDLFTNFLHLLSEGIEPEDAKKMLAEKLEAEPKTISRDISDIREFSERKKCPKMAKQDSLISEELPHDRYSKHKIRRRSEQ
ncbi:MAG: hypothetical protein HC887_01870 [Desulfobacteraceae bacterium]|nr:hypothetical protein [Desulfobacteraceae bacterium]